MLMIQDKIYTYFDGNDGLRVLFIFDQMLQIESELEGASWRDGYHYEIFDGRWFTTKYKIEHDWSDQKVVLLFPNMIEPSGDTARDHFPLFGEMTANMVFHNESYQAFMQLHGIPATQEYATFISQHIAELQLSKVDKILAEYYAPGMLSKDVLQRGLVSSYLGQERLLSWSDIIIRSIILFGLESEKKKKESYIRALRNNPDILSALSDRFEAILGRPLKLSSLEKIKDPVASFKYNAITQHLAPVPADDYKAYKITSALALQALNNFIQASVQHPLKDKFDAAVEVLGAAIQESQIIKWYGADADYALITESLCNPMLEALIPGIATSPESSNERLRNLSLKLSPDIPAQTAINFLIQACLLYERRKAFGTFKLNSRKDFIFRYKSDFCLIDMAYRKSVWEFRRIPATFPIYEKLAAFKNTVDLDYAKSVNEFNLEWMKCVREEGGSLNDIDGILHQQDFYKTHIGSSSTKVAVVISDALRYEVAVQLMQEFSEKKHTASLDVALAMLPTETKYCKDALLPHSDLRLQGDTMFLGSSIITGLKDRDNQLKKYHPDGVCLNYTDVKKNVMDNREALRKPVVYIYHDTIDSVSHDHPEKTAQACEEAVDELKDFIAQLHASYNFTNVILTADHGFLYNDVSYNDTNKHKVPEESIELKTRYYLTNNAAPATTGSIGITKLPLEKVSGMTHPDGVYVAVPDGSNRFFAPGGGYEFAHGGATLQELIIPVLFSYRKKVETKQKVDMNLVDTKLDIVSSQLAFKVIQIQAVSADRQERKIACGIYQGNNLVSNEKTISLSSTDETNYNNRIIRINLSLEKPVTQPVLELRIYDVDDRINPLLKMPVNNRTLIEQDF